MSAPVGEYARITSTTWDRLRPARSEVSGDRRGERFEFEHELGCPMQGSMEGCTCYVSRIRLVKTPVGRTIATTEPDLAPELAFWQAEARRLKLWGSAFIGIAVASSLLNILYGLQAM